MDSVETWRDISGYANLYQVSSHGRVRSTRYNKIRFLRPETNNRGYFRLSLYRPGDVRRKFLVHRLVAQAFLPPVEGMSQVDHLNGIRHDNRHSNLRWCTQSLNNLNSKVRKDSGSQIKGIYYIPASKLWRARLTYKGELRSGYFKSLNKAAAWLREQIAEMEEEVDSFYRNDVMDAVDSGYEADDEASESDRGPCPETS